MPLPSAPTIIRTAIIQRHFNQEIVNVLNWTNGSEPSLADVIAQAEAVAAAWPTTVMEMQSFNIFFMQVEARQAVPLSGLGYDLPMSPVPFGSITESASNPDKGTVISLRTNQAGRSYRGRLYIGGLPDNVVVNGLLYGSWASDMAGAVKSFLTTVEGATGRWPVVLSYYNAKALRPAPIATPIESAIGATPYPAEQRNRRVGIGS